MHVLPHPWSLCITLHGIRQYNHSGLNDFDRKLFLCRRLFYVFRDGIGGGFTCACLCDLPCTQEAVYGPVHGTPRELDCIGTIFCTHTPLSPYELYYPVTGCNAVVRTAFVGLFLRPVIRFELKENCK